MKQPSKKEILKLKKTIAKEADWEEAESFSATKPTSIRLSATMIRNLQVLAKLRGEDSYQKLLKRWVSERILNEMELLELAKKRHYLK